MTCRFCYQKLQRIGATLCDMRGWIRCPMRSNDTTKEHEE